MVAVLETIDEPAQIGLPPDEIGRGHGAADGKVRDHRVDPATQALHRPMIHLM